LPIGVKAEFSGDGTDFYLSEKGTIFFDASPAIASQQTALGVTGH
jgi:hypothetical protein